MINKTLIHTGNVHTHAHTHTRERERGMGEKNKQMIKQYENLSKGN